MANAKEFAGRGVTVNCVCPGPDPFPSHVMSRHVMFCHGVALYVMSCHVMSCHVMVIRDGWLAVRGWGLVLRSQALVLTHRVMSLMFVSSGSGGLVCGLSNT
eukprot:2273199-Rhodomonas_salina.1